jgi:hypothetical protein
MKYTGKILYPEQFNTSKIFTYPKFEEELKDILEKSGFKNKFVRLYRNRLKFLEERGIDCVQKSDWFEILKKTNGLYSMKFKSTKNLRIIFTFTGKFNENISILLCTFEEKDSKNNSSGSYSKAIETANKRLNELNDFFRGDEHDQ